MAEKVRVRRALCVSRVLDMRHRALGYSFGHDMEKDRPPFPLVSEHSLLSLRRGPISKRRRLPIGPLGPGKGAPTSPCRTTELPFCSPRCMHTILNDRIHDQGLQNSQHSAHCWDSLITTLAKKQI